VSRYSEHPEEAADLVRYLTSTAEQKRRAVEGSFNPTRRSVYADADVIAEDPLLEEFLVVLENAVARPSSVTGEAYNRVSDAFVQAVHATLSGRRGAGQSLDALEATLERMKSRGRW
jgi:trehalose/maltose transport system substrate-binding protein